MSAIAEPVVQPAFQLRTNVLFLQPNSNILEFTNLLRNIANNRLLIQIKYYFLLCPMKNQFYLTYQAQINVMVPVNDTYMRM